jgi:hypothetical protein
MHVVIIRDLFIFGEISQPGDKKKVLATSTKDLLGEKSPIVVTLWGKKWPIVITLWGEKLKLPDLDNRLYDVAKI